MACHTQITGLTSTRPVESGSGGALNWAWRRPLSPLSISYGIIYNMVALFNIMYIVTPQTCPPRWCAHRWGCPWGIGGCYRSRTPSLLRAPGWWPGGLIPYPYSKDVVYRYQGCPVRKVPTGAGHTASLPRPEQVLLPAPGGVPPVDQGHRERGSTRGMHRGSGGSAVTRGGRGEGGGGRPLCPMTPSPACRNSSHHLRSVPLGALCPCLPCTHLAAAKPHCWGASTPSASPPMGAGVYVGVGGIRLFKSWTLVRLRGSGG